MFDSLYAEWGLSLAPWAGRAVGAAILLIPAGIALLFWAGRQRFNRRNFAGVEEFSGYPVALASRLFEALVGALGAVLLLGGLLVGGFAAWVKLLQSY